MNVIQYDPAGRVVWKWHDPQRVGSINGVIILDGLDTAQLHDDVSFVLGPVRVNPAAPRNSAANGQR